MTHESNTWVSPDQQIVPTAGGEKSRRLLEEEQDRTSGAVLLAADSTKKRRRKSYRCWLGGTIKLTLGLRVSAEDEEEGLEYAEYGEESYPEPPIGRAS